ncbi:bifunctional diaminohydroxyphosphoribosylaminopyrimidine deaminase/5-amino-6-(5-phosphoribosylamino)uracil reductase RibD [Gulosibacter molinativorax]|uniref:Riboflavin biosynthesis protein RibD n=2 Tax=Gulosibacter molinativorax TaxID=256821 RepID=A0ABT7C8F8_9MICO|nr:bifunctional diaminohydroxyphosphoribosylaminopyrimidine deaminase/5-amino-6-(5-phosphoribosylamino)uracil reductase RibD [Gulosibacter molinativorax]
MRRAIDLAYRGPEAGPNPRVGCVILAPAAGSAASDSFARDSFARDSFARDTPAHATAPNAERRILGEGYHRGAGTAHAEVDALRDARERGADLAGATAIVTLEPCSHTGRTGPCTEALAAAGIREVIYAVDDPNPEAAGGATYLSEQGIRVQSGVGRDEAFELVRIWATSVQLGRPYVTLKLATTLDGKIAAEDGTSQWITSAASRSHAHETRSRVGAILVGTGTVLADDPSLTARDALGDSRPQQPLRVALGERPVPPGARMRGSAAEFLHLPTRDPREALRALGEREIRHVLVEGGASVAAAFLQAGLVDELNTYLAPVILGSGKSAVGPLGIETLADASRWHTTEVSRLGQDTFIRAVKLPAVSDDRDPGIRAECPEPDLLSRSDVATERDIALSNPGA